MLREKRASTRPTFFVRYKPDLDDPANSPRAHLPRREDPAENEIKWPKRLSTPFKEAGRQGPCRKPETRTDYLRNAEFSPVTDGRPVLLPTRLLCTFSHHQQDTAGPVELAGGSQLGAGDGLQQPGQAGGPRWRGCGTAAFK